MRDGFVSMGHGRALINIENKKDQLEIYEKVITNNLSVRETEKLVREYHTGKEQKTEKTTTSEVPEYISKNVEELTEYFSSKVDVKVAKNGKGKFIIPFHSKEDFLRLTKLFK